MDARGQETYQIIGEPSEREGAADAAELESGDEDASEDDAGIPQGDVDIVSQRTGASEDEAREALEATDGDLAAAIDRLE